MIGQRDAGRVTSGRKQQAWTRSPIRHQHRNPAAGEAGVLDSPADKGRVGRTTERGHGEDWGTRARARARQSREIKYILGYLTALVFSSLCLPPPRRSTKRSREILEGRLVILQSEGADGVPGLGWARWIAATGSRSGAIIPGWGRRLGRLVTAAACDAQKWRGHPNHSPSPQLSTPPPTVCSVPQHPPPPHIHPILGTREPCKRRRLELSIRLPDGRPQ